MRSRWLGPDTRMWSRSELRRRWLSMALLGVLGGLAAGLTMAAFDGAQRSSTAYARMREQLHGADAIVFPSQVLMDDFDPRVLDDLPEVESWAGFSLNASSIDGLPPFATPFIISGSDWFSTLEGAKVLEGRLPDPARDDEAVITAPLAKEVPSVHVGSRLVWRNLSMEQAEQFANGLPDGFQWTDAAGVTTELHVVGVVRLPIESVAAFAADGLLMPGPGWAAAHFEQTPMYFTNAIVRLRNGATDLPALQADIVRLTGRTDIPIKDLSTDIKRVQRSLDLEHTALLMFAGAIAATALVLVGQAIVRATSSGLGAVSTLRAMGMTDGALSLGLVLPMLVTVGATLVVAAVVSVVASRWFPVGLARTVDPITGIHVVAGREAVGLCVTALVTLVLVLGSAVFMQHRIRSTRSRRTRALVTATRAGLPVPPAIGVSLALDASPAGGGRSRLALTAAIAGMLTVVGALTLVHGIDDIVRHPERAGATWDLVVSDVGTMTNEEATKVVLDDPDIADLAIALRAATHIDGLDVPVYALDVQKGAMQFTVVKGRAPSANDEIALGPATMRLLHTSIGDTVHVGPANSTKRVVGVTLLSQQPHSSFDEGGWVTTTAYASLVGPSPPEGGYDEGFLGVADGVSLDAAVAHLPPNWQVGPPAASNDLANLRKVRGLPIYLAAFLALLAVGAVAHALFTGARQRAHELAVLRALGLSGRQAAACVSWQAIATGAVAVIAGIPLGLMVGRRFWRAITDQLSFVYVGPLASLIFVVAVPACLVACVVLAIIPARNAARRRIAEVLRQE